jgi:hypothetical protein
MSLLLDQYLRTCDPFHLGFTSHELLGAGYVLTEGTVFPYPAGGVVLRRRRLYPDVGPWSICGFARPNDEVVFNMTGFPHEANGAFQYQSAIVLGNGFTGPFTEPVRVDFDGSRTRITPPLPMFPRHVAATPMAGGKFRVSWEYDPRGQGAWPTDFQVFAGLDAGSVDYNTPLTDSLTGLDATPVIGARRGYELTSGAFADGTQRVFVVRARNSAGTAEKNTSATKAKKARTTTVAATAVEFAGQRRR